MDGAGRFSHMKGSLCVALGRLQRKVDGSQCITKPLAGTDEVCFVDLEGRG